MESATRRGLPRAMVDDVFLAPVHINAGGTVYTTTLDTLTKYPESKLAKLFDGSLTISIDPISRQYFLDVNGSVFAHVLDFLRYGELLLPDDFTQLPLLTKLAEFFGIREMVEGLLNMGGEESFGSQEDRTSVVRHKKKKRRNKNSLETTSDNVVGQEEIQVNKKENLEADSVKTDGVVDKSKINIGTCELGIVKLGTLEGGKVDFRIVESATMKGKRLESEMLETKALNAETVEMTKVNAEDVKIKTLETENLKLKTLDLETLPASIVSALSSISAMTNCETINANDSNFVMVQVNNNILNLLATDHELQVKDMGIGLTEDRDIGIKYWSSYRKFESVDGAACFFGVYLLQMFPFLSKNGYKLKNASVVRKSNSQFIREYIFAK